MVFHGGWSLVSGVLLFVVRAPCSLVSSNETSTNTQNILLKLLSNKCSEQNSLILIPICNVEIYLHKMELYLYPSICIWYLMCNRSCTISALRILWKISRNFVNTFNIHLSSVSMTKSAISRCNICKCILSCGETRPIKIINQIDIYGLSLLKVDQEKCSIARKVLSDKFWFSCL